MDGNQNPLDFDIFEYAKRLRENPHYTRKQEEYTKRLSALSREEKEMIFYENRKAIDITKMEKMFDRAPREYKRLCSVDGPSPIFESLRPDTMKVEIFKDMGLSFCMRCHRKKRRTYNLALCKNCVRCKTLEHCPAGDMFWHGHNTTDHLSDEEYNAIWHSEINRRKQCLKRLLRK